MSNIEEFTAKLEKLLAAIGSLNIDEVIAHNPSQTCRAIAEDYLRASEKVDRSSVWSGLIELCCIDVEWRIRHAARLFGFEVGSQAEASCCTSVTNRYLKFLEVEHGKLHKDTPDSSPQPDSPQASSTVAQLLPSSRLLSPSHLSFDHPSYRALWEAWQQIVLSQWRARSVWGDQPPVDQFVNELDWPRPADDRVGFRSAMEDELTELAPLQVAIVQDGRCEEDRAEFTIPLPARFVLGRQGRNEPSAPCWLAESSRLVVVPHSEQRLSREQVGMRRVKIDEIEATNLSSKVTITLDGKNMKPGESTLLKLPVAMTILKTQLHFALHDPI